MCRWLRSPNELISYRSVGRGQVPDGPSVSASGAFIYTALEANLFFKTPGLGASGEDWGPGMEVNSWRGPCCRPTVQSNPSIRYANASVQFLCGDAKWSASSFSPFRTRGRSPRNGIFRRGNGWSGLEGEGRLSNNGVGADLVPISVVLGER